MEFRTLGRTDIKVTSVCLGTMTWGKQNTEADAHAQLDYALSRGINFIDTAEMYPVPGEAQTQGRTESYIGTWIAERKNRDKYVLATKVAGRSGMVWTRDGDVPMTRHTPAQIDEAVEKSLKRLKTDYIDLYQIHRWDYETPIEETLAALHDLVKMGKVRYIGASSMHAYQFCKALYIADLKGWTRFIAMQNHYNLAYREEEREMNPLCLEEGIGLIPWSPLARGLLVGASSKNQQHTLRSQTDKIAHRLYTEHDFEIAAAVKKVAEGKNIPPAQVALAWLLQRPGVAAPIVGTTKLKHLEVAVGSVNVELTKEELNILEMPYRPKSVAGHQ